ncbi:hypothetical protein DFH27DRAFT_642911 [Peziza echinospora]|nr:hypothetical protein DFH27DRAFT_642911 [Peziza echinospora]
MNEVFTKSKKNQKGNNMSTFTAQTTWDAQPTETPNPVEATTTAPTQLVRYAPIQNVISIKDANLLFGIIANLMRNYWHPQSFVVVKNLKPLVVARTILTPYSPPILHAKEFLSNFRNFMAKYPNKLMADPCGLTIMQWMAAIAQNDHYHNGRPREQPWCQHMRHFYNGHLFHVGQNMRLIKLYIDRLQGVKLEVELTLAEKYAIRGGQAYRARGEWVWDLLSAL